MVFRATTAAASSLFATRTDFMGTPLDLKRLKRLTTIYTVVQVFLVLLMVYMGALFQGQFQALGTPELFSRSLMATLIIQLILFYPINKLAASDAEREVAASRIGLAAEELAGLRKKRIYADFMKSALFIFFIVFIARAPGVTRVLCITFFVFICSILTYFQCFNFTAKRAIKSQ